MPGSEPRLIRDYLQVLAAQLPAPIVEKLNAATRKLVHSPRVAQYFAQQALMTMDLDVAGVNRFLGEELAYWAPLAKEAGLRVQ